MSIGWCWPLFLCEKITFKNVELTGDKVRHPTILIWVPITGNKCNFSYDKTQEGSYESSYNAREGRYEGYREPDLPAEYAAYGQNGNAEAVYDRYDDTYGNESPSSQRPRRSLCKQLRSCFSDMGKAKYI